MLVATPVRADPITDRSVCVGDGSPPSADACVYLSRWSNRELLNRRGVPC